MRLTRNQEKYWGKGNYKGEKYIILKNGVASKQMCLNKLGKLEDLEEELGNNHSGINIYCSLKILFEATKYGFWYQVNPKKYLHLVPDDNHNIIYSWNDGYPILQYMEITKDICFTLQCVYDVFVTDYRKTFWLKEDKSE